MTKPKKSKKVDARKYSRLVVDGAKQTPSRAMLRAVGFQDADFEKPQIGVASTWANLTPCNMHINELASESIAGADEAGGKGVLFNTITVSDGISMGSPGMRYSLVSREVIADSIETVVGAEGFDGFVAIGGCDKNMPGCAMAIARLDRPAVFVYGGTIKPGAKRRDIVAVFEAVGGHAAGRVSDAELLEVERTAIPGPGSCGGMYTANTMASAIEAFRAHHRFDGIGDDFPGDQRIAHPGRPHGNTVGDSDRVEQHALAARLVHAGNRFGRELVDVHVAGREVRPGGSHADLRLLEVGVLESHGAQHGARRRLLRAIDHQPRVLSRIHRFALLRLHLLTPSTARICRRMCENPAAPTVTKMSGSTSE